MRGYEQMSETDNFKTFSEEVGDETIELAKCIMDNNLQAKRTLFVSAPTGKGKSHFIKNKFYDYCKDKGYKILYLLPRKVVKDGFIKELQAENKTDIVTVKAYQEFEQIEDYESYEEYMELEKKLSFSEYDVIICDECHYFISDSIFNSFTFRSYDRIFNNGADKLRIFITATPDPILAKIRGTICQNNSKDIPQDEWHILAYCELKGVSAVKDIKFFKIGFEEQKKNNVQNILNKIDKNDEKAIVFCDSKAYAHALYEQYPGKSIFICSLSDGEFENDNAASEKSEDHNKYLHMLTENNFECKYVFCTSALDVGFSIKDRQVKHIICMLHDWNGVIQAVGRKRIMNKDLSDRITLYLPYYSNQTIGKKRKKILECFEHWKCLEFKGAEAYMKKYEKIPDPAKIIYYRHTENGDCEPAIDDFVLWYHKRQAQIYSDISKIDSPEQHQDWIYQQFGLPCKRHEKMLWSINKGLKPFAESGKIFTQKDKDIINTIARIIGKKHKGSGTLVTGMKSLEEYLKSVGCDYMIEIGKKREKIDGKDKKTTTYQIKTRPKTDNEAEQQAGVRA